jgi:hypothetical protein
MKPIDLGLRLLVLLSPIVLGALTLASLKLSQFFSAHVKNAYLRNVLTRLDDAVFSAVKELEQTVVAAMKAASADGALSDAERQSIKQQALATVKSYLGMKGLEQLATVFGLDTGTIDGLLGTKIEAAVHDVRSLKNGVSSKPALGGAGPLASSPAA